MDSSLCVAWLVALLCAFPNHEWCSVDGLIASRAKTMGSHCSQDDDSQSGEIQIYSCPSLPEVWHGILKMRDFVQVCLSISLKNYLSISRWLLELQESINPCLLNNRLWSYILVL